MRLLLVDNASSLDLERAETAIETERKPAGSGQPSSLGLPAAVSTWCKYLPDTAILRNDRRLSYAANLNRILDASTARYVLLMNTDMYFDPRQQCLRRMVEFMDGRPGCGLAGCRVLHDDGTDAHAARRFQTLPLILARRCGMKWLLRQTVEHHFYAEHAPSDTFECDWLSGCFLMVRREAIEQVGHLEEGYGKYFEDVDLCIRMARANWQVLYHGAVSCYHLERRASRNLFSADAWLHLRAYLRWIRRWGLNPTANAP